MYQFISHYYIHQFTIISRLYLYCSLYLHQQLCLGPERDLLIKPVSRNPNFFELLDLAEPHASSLAYEDFVSIDSFSQLRSVFPILTKFGSNFGIEALNWICRFFYNSNCSKSNNSATLFRRSSANQIFEPSTRSPPQ